MKTQLVRTHDENAQWENAGTHLAVALTSLTNAKECFYMAGNAGRMPYEAIDLCLETLTRINIGLLTGEFMAVETCGFEINIDYDKVERCDLPVGHDPDDVHKWKNENGGGTYRKPPYEKINVDSH